MAFIKSNSIRYRLELLIFIFVMFAFQKYFIDFQNINNKLNDDKPEWNVLFPKSRE